LVRNFSLKCKLSRKRKRAIESNLIAREMPSISSNENLAELKKKKQKQKIWLKKPLSKEIYLMINVRGLSQRSRRIEKDIRIKIKNLGSFFAMIF
jgi:hypothetical protein